MFHKDCFAYITNYVNDHCSILIGVKDCNNCKFYKAKNQTKPFLTFYRNNCFAYSFKNDHPECLILYDIDCAQCKFFKTREQVLEENIICKKHVEEKLGEKYQNFFLDSLKYLL